MDHAGVKEQMLRQANVLALSKGDAEAPVIPLAPAKYSREPLIDRTGTAVNSTS